MDINTLKAALGKQQESLDKSTGNFVSSSPTGPVGISLVRAVIEMLEAQQLQIDEINRRLNSSRGLVTPPLE